MSKKINAAICGATGYSGIELLKLLSRHDDVVVKALSSESQKGRRVGDVLPKLLEYRDLTYQSLEDDSILEGVDMAFLCLPHEPAAYAAKRFLDAGAKVIDLSAAYRIKDLEVFERYYKFTHPYPELVEEAVYGLVEWNRELIASAKLIANPGCYPTSALLPLLPLIKKKLSDSDTVIIDSKSGFSGRGKKIDLGGLFVEMNENFYAYGLEGHRHRPEIAEQLKLLADKEMKVTFSPHVLPIDRGILSTCYLSTDKINRDEAISILDEYYRESPFVHVYQDKLPQVKWVANTNRALIGVAKDEESNQLIVVSVIDNLLKGASGQALQCMNIMYGLEETKGLK